jgi:drug/metabolite transporter (DMT)-like permease
VLALTAWQMVLGAVPLFIAASMSGEGPLVWSGRFVAVLAVTSLVSAALGWCLSTDVLKHVDAGIAGMSMLAVLAIAIASSAWHFGERLRAQEVLGMVLIPLALAIIALQALRRHMTMAGPLVRE